MKSSLFIEQRQFPGQAMKLRSIDFGHVMDASGVRGWFGDGYPFHRLVVPFGLKFTGSTFVAKTTTLEPHQGNITTRSDGLTPRTRQRCVKIDWRRGVVLNAFGLPGPGFKALLEKGLWQQRKEPFFLSFAAIGPSLDDTLREVRVFVRMLQQELPNFAAPIGLQVNFSCPNIHPREHLTNFANQLNEYQALEIPIMVKLSAAQSVESALAIAEHPGCDAICMSNSIAWGELSDKIDWKGIFGSESPLKEYGGGGLSGAPLLPIVADWVQRARARGLHKPINAGGGIRRPIDVDTLIDAGASSIFVGSIAMLRGWRLQATIQRARRLFGELEQREEEAHLSALVHKRA